MLKLSILTRLAVGIHGAPERLRGYIGSAPIVIGEHEYPDNLFISPNDSIGEAFSIILGQPFLTHYSARLDYSPSGRAMLYLWTKQDKERGARPTIGIAITSPSDPRNREVPSHTTSYVSVVPSDECDTDHTTAAQVFHLRALVESELVSPPSQRSVARLSASWATWSSQTSMPSSALNPLRNTTCSFMNT